MNESRGGLLRLEPQPCPRVHVSLDVRTLGDALLLAQIAVSAGIDWLEAGTPLIVSEGLRAVRALSERFPAVPIAAGVPIFDDGYNAVELLAGAGASWCVVLGTAHPATVKACVSAARRFNIGVMGDLLAAPDKAATARTLKDLGVDIVVLRTSRDEIQERRGASPWDDLAEALSVDLPVMAVGGLWLEDLPRLAAAGVQAVSLAAPLTPAGGTSTSGRFDIDEQARLILDAVRGAKGRRWPIT